ncbi:BglG family transcription antiterminator [Clostridium niameyense]|uniref:BglG family transcription antiterminator n=1 Tax=Clostridium niameyense TaxID=1622073 RepID=A0A6M0R8H2_9CLOT|nr:BglG family transcription antiterminator [Clostridium niameyense]NEZ46534.1 BglG family transcription antiterminator [Clostridium niameyense]
MIGNVRLEKIIEILKDADKVTTGKQLCNMLGVSSRTIRSDIKELNSILQNNGAIIHSEKSRGYKIEIFEENKFQTFLKAIEKTESDSNLISDGRAEYIIVKLLINDIKGIEGITQIELADELYVSLSSIKNDIKLAKDMLLDFKLKIKKVSNKGIKISGSEENIRRCINTYMFSNNNLLKEALDSLFKNFLGESGEFLVDDILKENIFKFKCRLSDLAYRHILAYIKIILIRNYKDKTVNYSNNVIKNFKQEPKFKVANSICIDIKEKMGFEILENEVIYLTKYMMGSNLIQFNKLNNKYKFQDENKLLVNILQAINNIFDIDFTKDDILINFLGTHLKASISRAKYDIKIENSMLGLIKNNYPFALELAVLTNSIIKREEGVNLTEDDIGFIALHFAAAIERKKHKNTSNIKKAIIVCTTGVGTSLLLKVKLEAHFKSRLKIIDTISCYEFNKDIIDKVDLVIATVNLGIQCDKIIHIKRLIDEEEINLIENKLYNNYSNLDKLATKFKENIFFCDVKVDSREEILDYITNRLINLNYITQNVKEDIFKREKLSGTQIGNLVAIPHSMHKEIKESCISVAILKKPIDWDKDKVQLVFLIVIADEDKYNWKIYLEQLYKNIIDEQVVLELIKSKNFRELKRVIDRF